jgi:hypothetical protein
MAGVGREVDTSEDVFQFRPKFRVGARFMIEGSIHERSEVLDNPPAIAARAAAPAQQGICKVALQRHTRIKRKSCADNENRSFAFW